MATLSLVAVGCHKDGPILLPTWTSAQRMYVPRSGTSNGFDDLALAAEDVQHAVNSKYLDRVSFTPGMRSEAIKQATPAIGRVESGLRKPIEFEFTAKGPFEPSSTDPGWRMIGRALVWRIENHAANAEFDAAISDAITSTKFGFCLTGGDSVDASLGFATVDDARRALAPHLSEMGAGQLQNLASGLERSLNAKPPMTVTFQHEKEDMLEAVQFVQDSFAKAEFSDMRSRLGADVRDSVNYLKDLRDKSSTKQAAYFQGLAAEATEKARWLSATCELPLLERNRDPGPRLEKERPWRTFAKHFFSAGEPLLSMRDATLARTRLMILEARILARVKSGQPAPNDLSLFNNELVTDPYTGREFIYKAAGSEFTLYSVGEDLKDDGGETDDSYSSKDLTIERS